MLDAAISLARLTLAVVLLTSGLAKLVDRAAFATAVAGFAILPRRLVRPASLLIPVAELLLAAGLLLSGAWVLAAALGTTALLATFSIAMAINLRRGRVIDCHCFGTLRREPVTRRSLLRNALLLALALLPLVAGPGPDLPAAVATRLDLSPGLVIALGLLALLGLIEGIALSTLISRRRTPAVRDAPAPFQPPAPAGRVPRPGDPAPRFAGPDLDGVERTLDDFVAAASLKSRPLLLLFAEPDCPACDTLLPELDATHRTYPHALDPLVVMPGSAAQLWLKTAALGLSVPILRQRGAAIADAYGITVTPTAILIDAAGHIAAAPAEGSTAITALVASLAGPPTTNGVERTASLRAIPLPLILIALLLLTTACRSTDATSTSRQDQTIAPAPTDSAATPVAYDAPAPDECQVTPRPLASLLAIAGTPAANTDDATLPPLPPPVLPVGTPADAALAADITATIREWIACTNAGDDLRAYALVTDNYLIRNVATYGPLTDEELTLVSETPEPLPDADRAAIVSIRDPLLLPDGRASAVVTLAYTGQPAPEPPALFLFARSGDRWLIDDIIPGTPQ